MSIVSLILYTAFILYLQMGFYGLRLGYPNVQNIIYFAICVLFGWWSFCFAFMFAASTAETGFFWFRLSYPGWFLIASPSLHFLLTITNDPWLQKKWIYLPIYLPGLFFLYFAYTGYLTEFYYAEPFGFSGGTSNNNPLLYWSFNAYYIGYILFGIYKLLHWGRRSDLQLERKQSRIISATAVTTILLVFFFGTLQPVLNLTAIPRIPAAMALIWVGGMWVAISRYRIMALSLAVASDKIITRIEDLLLLLNPSGRIIKVNPSLETVLGYQESELQRRPAEVIINPKERAEALGLLQQLKNGSLDRFQKEMYLTTKNGTLIPVRISAASLREVDGDLSGMVLVGKDMRETKQLQEEIEERKIIEVKLHHSLKKLQELDQLKTDFLSSVSHELRTPLTSILGFASIIKKRFNDVLLPVINTEEKKLGRAVRQLQENIAIIISEGQRLTNLINDVLDIAKMEEGRVEWKMESIELPDVVKIAMDATMPLFKHKGLSLEKELEADLPVLWGDRDHLVQVFINLLSNGMKFTQEGGVTVYAARYKESEILVRVVDTGIGIRPEDQEKVFEKFKQTGDTLKDKPKGTGLGLTICREIVEHHGGRIWVESTLEEGSSFCFTLPLEQDQTLLFCEDGEKKVSGEQIFSDKYILVVDDEENIRKFLYSELEEKGYEVREAANGAAALMMIKKKRPHLIILDVMMPVMSGFEVLEALKKDPANTHIPVILLTITEERERAQRLGFNDYFSKPVDIGALLSRVEELIS